jgi:3-methyladenine DNA glycosylase AlkC
MPTADEMLSETDLVTLIELTSDSATIPTTAAMLALRGTLSPMGIHGRTDAIAAALLTDAGNGFELLLDALLTSERFTGWMTLPVCDAVVRHSTNDVDAAMEWLRRLTPLLSSEFAARKMLARHGEAVLPTIFRWTSDEDQHVRRLASECTRPRLPWGQRMDYLASDTAPTRGILDALHDDESDYVRLSVANHVNDISKINPKRSIDHARTWKAAGSATTPKVISHGLRTLVKAANSDALLLVGIDGTRSLTVSGPVLEKNSLVLGEAVEFGFKVTNDEETPTRVAIDYVIHFVKANRRTSPKTFKLTSRTLAPGEAWQGVRRHPIVPINTRKYYAGAHSIQLQVNGLATAAVPFMLGNARFG